MADNEQPDDFIESGDPFDPQYQADWTRQRAEVVSEETSAEKMYYAQMTRMYKEVFSSGETSEAAIEFVMKDLARWARAYEPTFTKENSKVQDLLEGRRETFLRILQFTHLSAETLYVKYMMDAINRG